MSETLLAALWQVFAIAGTALIAGSIALWGVLSQRAIARRTLTLNHMRSLDSDKDMIAARKKFIELAGKPEGLTPWADPGKESSEEVQAIRLVLNDFELIAVGIQFGTIDYEFYRRYNRSTVIKYWYAAAPFVYSVRKQIKSNVIYHEFEEMARWFEDNRPPKRSVGLRRYI